MLNLDPNTPFPFWAKLWPSSIALFDVLKAHPHLIQNKHVLEIGAGIGLPSLMLAPITKSIQISDHDKEAVALLQKNIQHLQIQNAEALQLDWKAIPETLKLYRNPGSNVEAGLLRRRVAEGKLWSS